MKPASVSTGFHFRLSAVGRSFFRRNPAELKLPALAASVRVVLDKRACQELCSALNKRRMKPASVSGRGRKRKKTGKVMIEKGLPHEQIVGQSRERI